MRYKKITISERMCALGFYLTFVFKMFCQILSISVTFKAYNAVASPFLINICLFALKLLISWKAMKSVIFGFYSRFYCSNWNFTMVSWKWCKENSLFYFCALHFYVYASSKAEWQNNPWLGDHCGAQTPRRLMFYDNFQLKDRFSSQSRIKRKTYMVYL